MSSCHAASGPGRGQRAALIGMLAVITMGASAAAQSPEPARGDESVPEVLRHAALRDDAAFKYRIMVDKVYIGPDAPTEEADYRRHAQMGFNVLCPRWIDKDLGLFAQAAELAARQGMYSMFWLRGSLGGGWGRPLFVHRNGTEYDILSPNSEDLWTVMQERILAVARISQRLPVLGVFLDYEKYAPTPGGFVGHCYSLSYDEKILGEFAQARGLTLPTLRPSERATYLEEHGLHADFREFQLASWRDRVRSIREQVDRLNPRFQFAIYPSSFTLFVNEVIWTELATEQAPLLAAEHYTYGRGFPLKDLWPEHWRVSDDEGVALNVAYVHRRAAAYADRGPHRVLGGVDPIVPGGEDPQFAARSVTAMSQAGDGFWVFYEGLRPGTAHARSFERWWRVANEAIETGTFEVLTSVWEALPHRAGEFLPRQE